MVKDCDSGTHNANLMSSFNLLYGTAFKLRCDHEGALFLMGKCARQGDTLSGGHIIARSGERGGQDFESGMIKGLFQMALPRLAA